MRGKSYFSKTYDEDEDSTASRLLQTGKKPRSPIQPSNRVEGHNMRTDITFGKDIAMATSCILETGITYGFLHGYEFTDRRQLEFIKDFLEINALFIGHPMMLVGLFAELQHQRHQSIHRHLYDKYLEKSEDAKHIISSINASHQEVGEHIKITQDILGIIEKVSWLQQDLSNFRLRLKIMKKSVEDTENLVQDTDVRTYGAKRRIHTRSIHYLANDCEDLKVTESAS